jgi:hypothetical protein
LKGYWFLPVSASGRHEMISVLQLVLPAMTHCLTSALKAPAKETWAKTSETMSQNKPSFLVSYLAQAFCHSDRKLLSQVPSWIGRPLPPDFGWGTQKRTTLKSGLLSDLELAQTPPHLQ